MPQTETKRTRKIRQQAQGGSVYTGKTGDGKKSIKKTSAKRAKEIKRAVVGDNATRTGPGQYRTPALNDMPKKKRR